MIYIFVLSASDESENEELIDFGLEKNELETYMEINAVWSEEKYQIAFFILKLLREMLQIKLSEVSDSIGVTKGKLDAFETSSKTYYGGLCKREIVKRYAEFLDGKVEEKVKCSVYELICYFVLQGYTERNRMKMMQLILDKWLLE